MKDEKCVITMQEHNLIQPVASGMVAELLRPGMREALIHANEI